MANLKQDLMNGLGNEKYYAELELVRLANDANTNYKNKVKVMTTLLTDIATFDLAMGKINVYFNEPEKPVPAPVPAPVPEPVPATEQPLPGQSHAE